jgi:hypothetical protein
MVFNRPKRMMSPRAAARRIAQVSVEKEVRVLGVDMEDAPLRGKNLSAHDGNT